MVSIDVGVGIFRHNIFVPESIVCDDTSPMSPLYNPIIWASHAYDLDYEHGHKYITMQMPLSNYLASRRCQLAVRAIDYEDPTMPRVMLISRLDVSLTPPSNAKIVYELATSEVENNKDPSYAFCKVVSEELLRIRNYRIVTDSELAEVINELLK